MNEDKKLIAVENSPANMIRLAVEGKADLAQLKSLLDLQKEYEANEARKAYHKAMAEFKAKPPKIGKDRKVRYEKKDGSGKVGYSHASLGNVNEKISIELSKYGLSASWITKQNGSIAVTCKITHELGHSEETTLSAQADTTGSKNAIQAIGSTITYLERYTLLALTGLATYDMDDDGKASGAPVEYIDDKQRGQILDYLNEYKLKEEKLLAYMKVETIKKITKADFSKAISALENSAKKKEAKNDYRKL